MARRTICVVTGSRAEYGLLYWLMKEIEDDPDLKLQLVVTGTHLSEKFGFTYQQIQKDGFRADRMIDLYLNGDDPLSIAKYMCRCMTEMVGSLQFLNPDIVVMLGDRYEIFATAQASMLAGVPIAHIHGGEVTTGSMDDTMRHALTKLSHLHFAAAEDYVRRIVQMGENPDRVFNVGALGIDNIERLELFDRDEFLTKMGMPAGQDFFLITYHPETNKTDPSAEIDALIEALSEFPEYCCLFTGVNADPGRSVISGKIHDFIVRSSNRAFFARSLGQVLYLSAVKSASVVIGNSSSGIIEAPYLNVMTVNIGDRQTGRLMAPSIINCGGERNEIIITIKKALDNKMLQNNRTDQLPYGGPGASEKIKDIIKSISLEEIGLKHFYNLPVSH